MYRRPGGVYPSDFFIDLQENIHAYKHVIITGDLNADLLSDNSDTRYIKKLVNDSALTQLELGITHTPINPQFSPSCIDTIIILLISLKKLFQLIFHLLPLLWVIMPFFYHI